MRLTRFALIGRSSGAAVTAGLLGLATGCGSSGSSPALSPTGTTTPVVSPTASPTPPASSLGFAGLWSGPFTVSSGQTGATELTIDDAGSITGRAISTTAGPTNGQEGPVTGSVTPDGLTSLTVRYGAFSFTGRGRLTPNSANDRLTGTLTTSDATGITITVSLGRGPLIR